MGLASDKAVDDMERDGSWSDDWTGVEPDHWPHCDRCGAPLECAANRAKEATERGEWYESARPHLMAGEPLPVELRDEADRLLRDVA